MNQIVKKNGLVHIILLNWNNAKDTIECLASLIKIDYPNIKIVLIDNNSVDDSLAKIKDWLMQHQQLERTHIITSPENVGFAKGNNLGLDYAVKNNADFVLLLNNDTEVNQNFLSHMMTVAETQPKVGIVSCKIRYYNQRSAVWFAGGYIDYFLGLGHHYFDNLTGLRECSFITGCLMLIPIAVVKELGGLDERYFITHEDTEYSYRLKKHGYRLLIDGDVEIFHKVTASMGGVNSTYSQYYFHRNRMIFFSENLKGINKFLFYLAQFGFILPAWVCVKLCIRKMNSIKGAWFGYLDFFTNTYGKSRHF